MGCTLGSKTKAAETPWEPERAELMSSGTVNESIASCTESGDAALAMKNRDSLATGSAAQIRETESANTNSNGQVSADSNQNDDGLRTLDEALAEYGIKKVKAIEYVLGYIPCGGLWFSCIGLGVSYVSGLVQAIALLTRGDYMFGGFLCFFLAASIYHQSKLSKFVAKGVFKTCSTGIMDIYVIVFFGVGIHVKDAFTLLLAPYRVMREPDMGMIMCVNSSVSLLLGCKTFCTEIKRNHLGFLYWQYGEALVRRNNKGFQVKLLEVWAFCAVSSQVAFNALFMQVFHPALLALLCLPLFCVEVTYSQSHELTFRQRIKRTVLEPSGTFAPLQSSVFGIGQWDPWQQIQQGHCPALHHSVAQLVRLVVMMALMCFDFPAAPIRPMGWGILQDQLLMPARNFLKDVTTNMACSEVVLKGGIYQQAWADHCVLLSPSGSSAYKTLIVLLAGLGLPVYMVGMILLLMNPYYRRGDENEELNDEMADMIHDIIACGG